MRLVFLLLVSLVVTSCVTPKSSTPIADDAAARAEARLQREFALREYYELAQRLSEISGPIQRANVALCGEKVRALFGFNVEASGSHKTVEWKEAFDVVTGGPHTHPIVTAISGSMPASEVLKLGDVLLSFEVKETTGVKSISDIAGEIQAGEDYVLKIRRKGKTHSVTMSPAIACDYPAQLREDSRVNAFADGNAVYVTKGMMRLATKDQELALVLAHEFAHNIRKHIEAKQTNAMGGAILGAVLTGVTGINVIGVGANVGASAFSQEFEKEADYVGLYLAERSGFDMAGAEYFLRRMAVNHPSSIHLAGSSHPSTAKRFVAIRMAAKEIARKRRQGLPLVPEESSRDEASLVPEERGEER
ncbi:MAG: M48 family metallopeptidase [Alphaproteobacteria bacterium]|nr:M48 family metallopeptidase [Alphaproteobacteria bacterium]